MSLILAFQFFKKLPQHLPALLLFINAFLLISLLTGCTSTSKAYRNTYLIKYSFNQDSSLFDVMENAYSNNTFDLSELAIKVGYLGYCIKFDSNSTICNYNGNIGTVMDEIPKLSLYNTNSNSTDDDANLDIIKISEDINKSLLNPYFLIISIISTLVLLLIEIYLSISTKLHFPFTKQVTVVSMCLKFLCLIIWLIGSVWYWLVIRTSTEISEPSSLNLLAVEKGSKAAALTWVSLIIFIVVLLASIIITVLNVRRLSKQFEDGDLEKSTK